MDGYREIFPVSRPDADDLMRFMGNARAHYQHHRVKDGGVEILAKGGHYCIPRRTRDSGARQ
ncbi:MAG: hypothetical protein ABSF69_20065 [Polyangiaceae bacterium]